jgi:hypothetical protein
LKRKDTAPSRRGRGGSWKTLLALILLAAVLATTHALSHRRDVALATGEPTSQQLQFFVGAVDRPDLVDFFKGLRPEQRLAMARNIGRHDHPQMAALLGKLLDTFDREAREALTESLVALAQTQPEAVSRELRHAGGFQRAAVWEALDSLGDAAIALAAARLTEPETRPQAAAYLVERGSETTPALLQALQSEDRDVRLAAADALGRLREPRAVPHLLRLYEESAPEDRVGYMTALASIGPPTPEDLLLGVFQLEELPDRLRAQAALGLGRLGTEKAVQALWQAAGHDAPLIRDSAISGLKLAGSAAIAAAPRLNPLTMEVAGAVDSRASNATIAHALLEGDEATVLAALRAAHGREDLVEPLKSFFLRVDVARGEMADAAASALLSTSAGSRFLDSLADRPELLGIVERRRRVR